MPSTHAAINAAITCTPARNALASHLQRLHEASEAVAVARRPLDLATDQAEHARKMVSDAAAALAALDAREAESVAKTFPPAAPTAKAKQARADAADALAHARRTLAAVEGKAEAARDLYNQAIIAVRDITSDAAALINAVLAEGGHDAVAHLGTVRAELAQAEAAVDSIRAVLAERQAFREAEAIALAVRDLRFPTRQLDPARYRRLAERLGTDADATAELPR
jgi:hypothetical protein